MQVQCKQSTAHCSINMNSVDLCLLILQVFRTEHYSHAIKSSEKSGPLGLIAILVYTIAAVALVSCAIAHPGELQSTLLHPQQSLATVMSPAFPWRQVAFTGLLSTDFVIYIEVGFSACTNSPSCSLSSHGFKPVGSHVSRSVHTAAHSGCECC